MQGAAVAEHAAAVGSPTSAARRTPCGAGETLLCARFASARVDADGRRRHRAARGPASVGSRRFGGMTRGLHGLRILRRDPGRGEIRRYEARVMVAADMFLATARTCRTSILTCGGREAALQSPSEMW